MYFLSFEYYFQFQRAIALALRMQCCVPYVTR